MVFPITRADQALFQAFSTNDRTASKFYKFALCQPEIFKKIIYNFIPPNLLYAFI